MLRITSFLVGMTLSSICLAAWEFPELPEFDYDPTAVIGVRVTENWVNADSDNQYVELVDGYLPDYYLSE